MSDIAGNSSSSSAASSSPAANKFRCDGCGRSYTWKPELAGRRVKCKCGTVMTVPQESPAAQVETDEDALYALADIEQKASKNQPVMVVEAPAAAPLKPKAKSGGRARPGARGGVGLSAAGVPLAYQSGPTARDRARGDVTVDMTRDIYAPLTLLIAGLVIYVGYYAFKYHMGGGGIAMTTVGLCIMTAIKAAFLITFALIAAGPLGVSFGHPGHAILKLAAMAAFNDGVTTWVDAGVASMAGGAGGLSIMISFPVSLAVYWLLMIYLFSMDSGDSWMTVVLITVCDMILRWVIMILLLSLVLGWGGVAASSVPTFGGSPSKAISPSVEKVNDLKDANALVEARSFIADGHQAIFAPYVDEWYANGAPKVWFSISRDFNGKRSPDEVIVELPKDKAKRAKCFEVFQTYLDKEKMTAPAGATNDTGDEYMFVPLRMSF